MLHHGHRVVTQDDGACLRRGLGHAKGMLSSSHGGSRYGRAPSCCAVGSGSSGGVPVPGMGRVGRWAEAGRSARSRVADHTLRVPGAAKATQLLRVRTRSHRSNSCCDAGHFSRGAQARAPSCASSRIDGRRAETPPGVRVNLSHPQPACAEKHLGCSHSWCFDGCLRLIICTMIFVTFNWHPSRRFFLQLAVPG